MSFKLQLSQQISQNKLPHAVLIQGAKGAGKLELATWLVEVLACQHVQLTPESELIACNQCKGCKLSVGKTNPDHLTLIPHGQSLGVDDIRHANSFIEKTAHIGRYKTVLIPNAQSMTIAAANALLKTLEEPTADSIIILLSQDIEALLPTIVSRCHVLSIRTAIGKELFNQYAIQSEVVGKISHDTLPFVNISQLPELCDDVVFEQYLLFKQAYIDLLNQQGEEQTLLVTLKDNEHGLRWLEKVTVDLLRMDCLRMNKNDLSASMLNQLYKVIISSSKVIKSHAQANEQFVLEQLLMKMATIISNQK